MLAAARRDSVFDHVLSVTALAVTALPEFVVAVVLIIFFAAVVWHLFPAVSVFVPGTAPWSNPKELVLPVATLVIVVVPYVFRMMRASMIDALESDYVQMARLKGVPKWRVLLVHALPNAIAPTIQVIGLSFLYLAGGVVVVEYMFNYPGLGHALVSAVSDRDIPVIQFIVLVLAAFYIVVNILTDVISLAASPRRRLPGDPDGGARGDRSLQRRPEAFAVLGRAVRTPRGAIGLVIAGCVVLAAAIGPAVAPYSSTEFVTTPFARPSSIAWLGGDVLGRDVLSRTLDGGWELLLMAAAATALGVAAGAALGVIAAYAGGMWDSVIMRVVDVFLAFPQLVFALLLVSILGPKIWLIVLAVAISHAPQVAKVTRAAALDDQRARLRQGHADPRHPGPPDHPPGRAAQPDLGAHGGDRAAAHILHAGHRRTELPRLRPAAAGGAGD